MVHIEDIKAMAQYNANGLPWVVAALGTMTASGLKTKRQEAKAAADAAAAAAADACAICDKVYGEDTEKDESWIACDRCNRWYHGTCVGMTQVQPCCHQSPPAIFVLSVCSTQ